jgi:catechol 2,3-dioxygenase-like lactoylglutathione lyase family enzyme
MAGEFGIGRIAESPSSIAWDAPIGISGICLSKPFDGQPATPGNGVMIGLAAKDHAQVDRLHALALIHGGTDEGAPGPRGEGFYAAYFRDPDGNKLQAFVSG